MCGNVCSRNKGSGQRIKLVVVLMGEVVCVRCFKWETVVTGGNKDFKMRYIGGCITFCVAHFEL
jgi:hypothetical protein